MAGRTLNRRELRRQSDAAESAGREGAEDETDTAEEGEEEAEDGLQAAEGSEEGGDEEAPATKAKAKPKAARKTRKPKAAPRMRARWGVFDSSMKQLAVFDYKDRPAAESKLAELQATRKTGTFFLQLVKEPMPEDAPPAAGT